MMSLPLVQELPTLIFSDMVIVTEFIKHVFCAELCVLHSLLLP
jgi:hypothetical protein